MRVLYDAVSPGVTDHLPSVPSGPTFLNARAVPEMKYSSCVYPTRERSKLVEATNGVPGPVIGPSSVGLGTSADATGATTGQSSRAANAGPARPNGNLCTILR